MNARLWLALALTATIAACGSSVKLDDTPAAVEDRTADGTTQGSGAITNRTTAPGANERQDVAPVQADTQPDPLDAPDGLLAQRTIFFDYDSFTIRDEFRPLVEAHARYLIANPERRIVLQGNTDERGAREYNLALGQKRSEAVRRALAVLGVLDNQVEAISFGEERPKSISQTETAYAENRRVDIVYQ